VFEQELASSQFYTIQFIDSIMEFIISSLSSLKSTLIDLVIDTIGKKDKGMSVVFKFACLVIEARCKTSKFSVVSYNAKSKRGLRVTRGNGRDEIRSIPDSTFERDKVEIVAFVLRAVKTNLSCSIADILVKNTPTASKINSLGKIKVPTTASVVGHFTVEIKDPPSCKTLAEEYMKRSSNRASSSSTDSRFVFKQFNSDKELTLNREVTWSTNIDQKQAISLFFSTMKDKRTLTGLVNNTTNIEYLVKLCDTLFNTMDPSKLERRLKKQREESGVVDDDDGEEDSDEADSEVDGIDFSDANQVRNAFREEVEGALDPVLFQIGGKEGKGDARKSTRIRNCLATMRQVGLIFGKEYGFSFLGSHVGQEYAQKHLRLKFETEIKAFLTCGNSPRRFISIYSNPQVFWKKVRRQGGSDCGYIILP
jgi:hypothetical protein